MSKNLYDQLCEEENQLLATLSALRLLKNRYAPDGSLNKNDLTDNVPNSALGDEFSEYKKNDTIENKILYALSTLGSGTSRQVASKLLELEPSYGDDKAIKNARLHLSALYNGHIIHVSVKGSGRKGHEYTIKNKA